MDNLSISSDQDMDLTRINEKPPELIPELRIHSKRSLFGIVNREGELNLRDANISEFPEIDSDNN